MRPIHKIFTLLCCCLMAFQGLQAQESANNEVERFIIRGVVKEKETDKPIEKVNIEVNGGAYTTTNPSGEFTIEASLNDEIVIRHRDFETVYYTVLTTDRVHVEVTRSSVGRKYASGAFFYSRNGNAFNNLIDSAEIYKKTDVDKSLDFITEALNISSSSKQNAQVYEMLGDVYFQWRQYDLSVTNFRISLQSVENADVQLKLARAYAFNKNYQESLDVYKTMDLEGLSNWQQTLFYQGLGDVYFRTKKFEEAIAAFEAGLKIAKKHLITPKITDLNSQIAETYDGMGVTIEAQNFYKNSLNLAEGENKTRALQEKVKVADFQNRNEAYDTEIELRKQALDDIEEIKPDSIFDNTSALTPQKQKYKIGNAYALQNDFVNAIPYLEESIIEADSKEDLVVKKDATRKLSEVYRDAGDLDKAFSTAREYERLVDELYVKKEQEISQAARFRSDITDKQNRISSLEKDRALSESKYKLIDSQNRLQQIIIYSLVGGVILLLIGVYYMRKNIKQERLNNNLLALKSLRSQMNPHFIFNALNSVNSFIATNDERTANRYLSDFSMLMRAVLENSEEDFIPLEKEIKLLELYTKLEHFRFKDKFDYQIHISEDLKVQDFQIPPMLLQPYIENAVWHGLRYKKEKGMLEIKVVQLQPDEIQITIADDGIGRQRSKALKTQNQQKQNSKGMGNIKKRVAILNDMYKDKVDVLIEDYQQEEDTGTRVIVTLKKD